MNGRAENGVRKCATSWPSTATDLYGRLPPEPVAGCWAGVMDKPGALSRPAAAAGQWSLWRRWRPCLKNGCS